MSEEPRDELDELIEGYADGQLDTDQAHRLLELIQSSPDARARLAAATIAERLLRELARPPLPPERILAAIAAQRGARPVAPAARPSSRATRAPIAALVIIALLVVGGFYIVRDRPSAPPAPATPPPTIIQPEPDIPAPVIVEPPVAKPDLPAPETPPPETEYRPVYAWTLPPPPDELGPDPLGDGSKEPGFVPPPAPAGEVSQPDEVSAPTVPLLWTRVPLNAPDQDRASARELNALLAAMNRRFGIQYRAAITPLAELSDDPARHPMILVTTHHRFAFTPEQRAQLRRFILRGGTILFDAATGSAPAADAARRETRRIMPERPVLRLSDDHPLFHASYNISGTAASDLLALSIDCRAAIIISQRGLAAGWIAQTEATASPAHEEAIRLGLNIASYAASTRAWTQRDGGNVTLPLEPLAGADRISIAQLMYDGDWQPRPAALALLLHAYNRQTAVPVKLSRRALRADDPAVANAPMLYLSGHGVLTFTPAETANLRRHLENGAFLLAESCCGRAAFDQSFRIWIAQTLPAQKLEAVPPDDPIFRTPHRVELLAVTESLAARRRSMLIPPHLEGIRIGGHYAVLYSPLGLAGAWAAAPVAYADAYNDPAALKLGQNLIHYAITH